MVGISEVASGAEVVLDKTHVDERASDGVDEFAEEAIEAVRHIGDSHVGASN